MVLQPPVRSNRIMRFDRTALHLELNGPNPMRMADHKESPLSNTIIPRYQRENGYLTQTTRETYIKWVVETRRLPHGRGTWKRLPRCRPHMIRKCRSSFGSFSLFLGQSRLSELLLNFTNTYLTTTKLVQTTTKNA